MLRCSRMLANPHKYGRACVWERLSFTLYLNVLFTNRYYHGLLYRLSNIFTNLLFPYSLIVNDNDKNVGSLWKPVSTIQLRPKYWGGELILSPVRIWLTPQPYKYWCFGYRFSGRSGWPRSTVFGVLRLRHIAGAVMMRTRMSHFGNLLFLALSYVTLLFCRASHLVCN